MGKLANHDVPPKGVKPARAGFVDIVLAKHGDADPSDVVGWIEIGSGAPIVDMDRALVVRWLGSKGAMPKRGKSKLQVRSDAGRKVTYKRLGAWQRRIMDAAEKVRRGILQRHDMMEDIGADDAATEADARKLHAEMAEKFERLVREREAYRAELRAAVAEGDELLKIAG